MQEDEQSAESTPEDVFRVRLRKLREDMKISQTAIANMATLTGRKLDPTAVTKIEKGDRSIRLNEAIAIASALGRTLDEMLRPTKPIDRQLEEVDKAQEQARWRAAEALAEYRMLRDRAARLRDPNFLANLEEGGLDNDGEHRSAP